MASCTATLCAANEYVSSNVCTACAAGKTNAAGDDASRSNGIHVQQHYVLKMNMFQVIHVQHALLEKQEVAGDDASGSDGFMCAEWENTRRVEVVLIALWVRLTPARAKTIVIYAQQGGRGRIVIHVLRAHGP